MFKDCRLDDAAAATCADEVEFEFECELELNVRALASEIFGLSSLRPLDGESAASRCIVVSAVVAAVDDIDATEPVEALRSPENEIDSRFLRVEPSGADTCRGTREVDAPNEEEDVEGEPRTDTRWLGVEGTAFDP